MSTFYIIEVNLKNNSMKKTMSVLLVFLIFATVSHAQALTKGDDLVSAGFGLGSVYFGEGFSTSLPVNPTITYEKAVTDDITFGGTVSLARSKYSGTGFSYVENAVYIGARGAYHFNNLFQLNNDKLDVYGGVSLGYVVVSVSDNNEFSGTASGGVGYALFAGGRYYFAPKVAVYAEVGYSSLSVLNVGVTFKF